MIRAIIISIVLWPVVGFAGSVYTPPSSSSSASVSWDWPVTTPVLTDFANVTTIGGGVESCMSAIILGPPKLRGLLKANCTTTWGATDRAMGMVRAVGGGDFRIAMRLRFSRTGIGRAAGSAQLLAGVAFVDGASAAANSWFGASYYLAGNTLLNSTVLKLESTMGAARWDTYSAFSSAMASPSMPESDWVIERIGTDLNIYIGPSGGAGFLIATHTVSGGAGYVGVRSQTLLGDADAVDIAVTGYRSGLSGLPW